jgi:hypothetical protein
MSAPFKLTKPQLEYILDQREAGKSWPQISAGLAIRWGVTASREAVAGAVRRQGYDTGRVVRAQPVTRRAFFQANAFACANCRHGIENSNSETGWECAGHLAMRCKPHAAKACLVAREVER